MPQVLLKTGELREIPSEEMLTFLQENRDLIEDRKGTRKRKIKRPELIETTNTK